MRRLMRFNHKALLAVETLVSIWLGLHVSNAREQKKSVQQIRQHHGWVAYDYQIVDGGFDASAESSVPTWLRQMLGDDFFHSVAEVSFHFRWDENGALSVSRNPDVLPLGKLLSGLPETKFLRLWGTQVTDENLAAVAVLDDLEFLQITDGVNITDKGAAHLNGLQQLQRLSLTKSQITDKSLQVFSQLPNLKDLNLNSKYLSDDGLRHLANHKRLEHLRVCGQDDQPNAVGDKGMMSLRRMPKLRFLAVQNTQVTDKGIMSLCSVPNPRFLAVKNTQVTDSGINSFMAKCPNCQVQR